MSTKRRVCRFFNLACPSVGIAARPSAAPLARYHQTVDAVCIRLPKPIGPSEAVSGKATLALAPLQPGRSGPLL